MRNKFKIISDFKPTGDQPRAIKMLADNIQNGINKQVLLGVTGSGKTFTVANVIEQLNMPTLVLAHNKILAAQLYREFKELFPENAVEYFVSYYDYYQPEAYIPTTDTYIEKDSSINEDLDKMRLSATRSLLERNDVIIVSSVSCIYGIGSPDEFHKMVVYIEEGMTIKRDDLLRKLIEIQYQRNDLDFSRGNFRVRGDIVDIYPAYDDRRAIRIEFYGNTIDAIWEIDSLKATKIRQLIRSAIYPSSHYVTSEDRLKIAIETIKWELEEYLEILKKSNKLIEAQRIEQRTNFDLEMLQETGTCSGIENYSRHLTGLPSGTPPPTLIDYFGKNFLTIIDESHVSIPQVKAMFNGDRSRKMNLVEYGFRLPSALDNRPLRFEEFNKKIDRVIYVSATPSDYEMQDSGGIVAEQLIRPTGLIDPEIIVKPVAGQVDDLLGEIRSSAEKGERVLVTTLTKKMAEELTSYYCDVGVRAKYMHSDIKTIERTELIRDLRLGNFDVLIGINLLREGLDLPEVSLVAILDADKEGFLRSETSLIQTCGRAARNILGRVIMYAASITRSMQAAISETNRRRKIQLEYNKINNITPESIKKSITTILDTIYEKDYAPVPAVAEEEQEYLSPDQAHKKINEMKKDMKKAAKNLEFEKAALLRDKIIELENKFLETIY